METLIKTILVPTDFSELSECALKTGISIARRQNAEIILLHVADRFAYLQPSEVFLPDVKVMPDIKLMMEEKLSAVSKKINEETGIKISGKVINGSPSEEICQFAYKENANLIVMGTHGSSGLREFFIGSEAFRVVKNASCPVLTIPGNWGKTDFEKVVFPVRLVPGALNKYVFARPIIEKNNSKLLLLGLAETKNPDNQAEMDRLIEKFKLQLYMNKVSFTSEICLSDNFAGKVMEKAEEFNADLIVLTANLDSNFKAYFLGPYIQRIVNHSKRPVLSIKPKMSETVEASTLAAQWGNTIDYSELGT